MIVVVVTHVQTPEVYDIYIYINKNTVYKLQVFELCANVNGGIPPGRDIASRGENKSNRSCTTVVL